ncbi:MAG: hypothetical protein CL908_14980 [Deltaproteobacteria bacterium]|nr:hypothetical protein [Deltaproteobacteria bacterium]
MNEALSEAERSAILEGLSNGDEELRRLAVEQLLLLPIAVAVPRLVECLGDSGWRVRKAAVERLLACGDEELVREMLVAALADGENPGRRNSAFEVLVASGPAVTARLVAEMRSDDVDVRKLVVDALAAIGAPESREPLTLAIGDPDPNVRAAAAEALGVVGGVTEITCLMEVATDPEQDVLVRLSALRALAQQGSSVGTAGLGDTLDVAPLRSAALELLGYSADPAAEDLLLKGLVSDSGSCREAAIGALLRRLAGVDDREALALRERLRGVALANDGLIEFACDRLEEADLAVQLVLIQFLGLLDDSRAVVPILRAGRDEALSELADGMLEALGDEVPVGLEASWPALDSVLHGRACAVLGRIPCEASERLLVDSLASPDGELRGQAALALGAGGFFRRIPDLVWRLERAARSDEPEAEDDVSNLIAAIVCLAEHPEATDAGVDVQLIEILSSRLGGAPEPVRLAIAHVLARLGREQDEELTAHLLKDESSRVRCTAVQALTRFDFDRARDALRLALVDESDSVRMAAVRVLGGSGQMQAAEDLTRMLVDDDPRVIALAVRSLGQLHHAVIGASEGLYSVIEDALRADPIVVLTAIETLVEVGGERAGAIAVRTLGREEPEVLRAALSCIGLHGTDEDLAQAIPLLSHSDWSVRAEVVRLLAGRAYRKGLPAMLRQLEIEGDAFARDAILCAVRELEE